MSTIPTLETLKAEVRNAGFTPSVGSWESETSIYAFSVESCGPATLGHPRFEASYSKLSGWARIGNREIQLCDIAS